MPMTIPTRDPRTQRDTRRASLARAVVGSRRRGLSGTLLPALFACALTGSTSCAPQYAERSRWRDGLAVVVTGRVSDSPWQHLVGSVEGKRPMYFDLAGDAQTVIYVAEPIECPGMVELRGEVVEIRGKAKSNDELVVLHVDVASHRCL